MRGEADDKAQEKLQKINLDLSWKQDSADHQESFRVANSRLLIWETAPLNSLGRIQVRGVINV